MGTFSGNIKLTVAGSYSGSSDLDVVSQAINYSKKYDLTNGTGANQANMYFSDQRVIGASPDDLDLYGGLVDAYGTTINFVALKGITVVAAAANSGDITLGGDGVAALVNWVGDASDTVVIKPGGMFALVDPGATGYAVTDSTADILQVSGTQNDVYDIILVGEV